MAHFSSGNAKKPPISAADKEKTPAAGKTADV
jgi:hypothetical protein